ncbi:MAG: sulfotransferase [Limisphaerales bacterium]
MSAPKYFLFCGVGRSGTTALRKALGLHPEIYYNGMENNIVQDVVACALRNCTMSSRKESMVVSQEQYDSHFRRLLTDILWPEEEKREGKTLLCSYNPGADIADYMVQLFGSCKILYIVRNGIEVVASRQRFSSFAHNAFPDQCDVWLRSKGMLDWGRQHPEVFKEFRYEWLNDETQIHARLSDVFQWFGLTQTDICANHVLSNRYHPTLDPNDTKVVNAEYAGQDSSVRQKMSAERQDRWKCWTPEERQIFEQKCGAFMQELGYPLPWQAAQA